MSQEIISDITFFYHSVITGIIITFVYDWLLIFRRLVRHNCFLVSVEDFFFWIACGLSCFYMLYKENNGVLRWFAVAGAAIGIFLYKKIIGSIFINIMSTIIHKIMWLVFRLIQIVLKPVKCLIYCIRRYVRFVFTKFKKCISFLKNRLTVCIKMLKIFLCKQ